jgi:hypothetical protein
MAPRLARRERLLRAFPAELSHVLRTAGASGPDGAGPAPLDARAALVFAGLQLESEGTPVAMTEQAGALFSSPFFWGGLVLIVLLAHFAREPARGLIDAAFVSAGEILERFAASTRGVGHGLFGEARMALAQMQREEFAHEVAARQKELINVLERFGGLEERYQSATEALERAADAKRRGRDFKSLMALAARMAAGQERFNTNVEYVTANRARLEAVHAGEIYSYSPFIRLAFAAIFIPFIALAGVLNFILIERPLGTLFADAGFVILGGVDMGEVCAATIIVIEAVIGFFFLESLRVTKVLPNFHGLAPPARRAWAAAFALVLLALSGMEAALAIWREGLIALSAQVEAEVAVDLGAAPLVFQIVLGVLMPFVLALVAIPLEAFLKNARVVALFLIGAALMLLALPLQVVGVALKWAGGVIWAAYETLAFLPGAVSRLASPRRPQGSPGE